MSQLVLHADVRDYLRIIALSQADALARRLSTLAKREDLSLDAYLATHSFHLTVTSHRRKKETAM